MNNVIVPYEVLRDIYESNNIKENLRELFPKLTSAEALYSKGEITQGA